MRSALHKRERGFFHYSFSRAPSKSGNVLLFNSVTLRIYKNECLSNYGYRTRAIITRSRFETALDYKPRIFKVRKVSLYYKPLCNVNRGF